MTENKNILNEEDLELIIGGSLSKLASTDLDRLADNALARLIDRKLSVEEGLAEIRPLIIASDTTLAQENYAILAERIKERYKLAQSDI